MNIKRKLAVVSALALFSVCATVLAAPAHPNRDEIARLDEAGCADGFSFAVMADSHVSRDVFPRIIDMLGELKPDFAVTVGDLTDNGLDEEYAEYVERITAVGLPWFTVPGNHEYRTPDGHTSPTGKKRFEKVFGAADFFFDHCGWRFVGMDVVAYDSLLPGQLKKLEKAAVGFDGRWAVFMHYPPMIIEKWEDGIFKSGAAEYMRILEEKNARFSFHGHIHVFDRLLVGPTEYVVTGGASARTDEYPPQGLHDPEGGGFSHFVIVDVKGDEAAARVMRVAAEEEEE